MIGAGHAGLAMSKCLTDRSIDHVVLERGEVAHSWKTERWDSLRLLTPNWQSRLPGYDYEGDDPGGFRTMAETIAFIEGYAREIDAPVQTHAPVTSVALHGEVYSVTTAVDTWHCRAVVIASGACNVPSNPSLADSLPRSVTTLSAERYRNPEQLVEGGVLIVGASATGTQIADEVHRSGRPVTLAVGEHIRVPRTYRGRDIQWWMDLVGVLDERYDEADNLQRVRSLPSLQLTGSDDHRTLGLNELTDMGVALRGRLVGISDGRAQFSGSLVNQCELSDLKMDRLLERIDEWAIDNDLDAAFDPPHRFEPTRCPTSPSLTLDLRGGEISTVIWATGFRPDYSWLDVDVLDRKGRVLHEGGVVEAPGMYLMGIPFLRRRKSSLIDGAGEDARELSAHLAAYLGNGSRRR